MVRKPDIQYVGQFYVHGSEARKLELENKAKKPKTSLPLARLEKIQQIKVEPVAIFGVVMAAVMLVCLFVGAVQIRDAWDEYGDMAVYLSELKKTNAELEEKYHAGYDLEEIQAAALAMGMVPKSELESVSVWVTIPEPEEEPSALEEAWDYFKWFIDGLFA